MTTSIALPRYPDSVVRLSADESGLPLILMLLGDFRRQAIRYCYWKSSHRVRPVLAGEGDLDILVARRDQHLAQAILLSRGYKRFPSVSMRDHPAIESYLGYDEPSGRLVHVHLHYQIVTGERLHKNYRIPWETAILERAIPHPAWPINTLDPASEATLLAVRACLELRRADPVTLRGWRGTITRFRLDQRRLAGTIDRAQLTSRATELLGGELGPMVAGAICDGSPLDKNRVLRSAIRKHFAPHRSYNGLEARLRGAARALHWAGGILNKSFLHVPRPWNRRAPGGGCVVAIVGLDGSGKSTVNAKIRAWLGPEIDVMPIYFGTGDGRPSLLLRPLKLMVPILTPLLKKKAKRASHGEVTAKTPGTLYSLLLIVWAIVVAHERRGKLLAAHRGASRGLVVTTDRYPQSEIDGFNDGPLLTHLAWAPSWLRRWEAATYALARRLPPDLVIKLKVSAKTVEQREPSMDPSTVKERIEAFPRLTFFSSRVVVINAEQPLADVLAAIKREIWRIL